MKQLIKTLLLFIFLLSGSINLSAQFLEIRIMSFKDSISIFTGKDFTKGYGSLDNPSIVDLKQDSLHFCFILKTKKLINNQSYLTYYLFAGVKKNEQKQIIIDYEMFKLNQEIGLKSLFIIDPVIIIDPITVLVKYILSDKTPSKQEKLTSLSKEYFTILRLQANGIDKYRLHSSGGRLFHHNTPKIRTNEH